MARVSKSKRWVAVSGLTDRQKEVLKVIEDSVRNRGYAPSMREIGEIVGLTSPSSVKHQLLALEAKGYIRRDPNRPRALELLATSARLPFSASEMAARASERKPEPVLVPLVGRIAAGGPIMAEQSLEDVLPLPRELVGDGELFMLRVLGDSMSGVAICDGDWVVVRSQPTAENGEIVAALLDDEATVKTWKRAEGIAWLLPANPSYPPIPAANATILGRVVAVLRAL
ncbi:MAG: transcriptional repressor LexA [Bifidobacteriaceae bacterium]|jgi:repressor LexA|nr:transcriptional repressor LexA [Bifidobacteriaceae bacterium]